VDTLAVKGEVDAGAVPHGNLLLGFTESVLLEKPAVDALRLEVLETLGAAAFVDVCTTIASFNAVVKVADGTGIPLEAEKAERTMEVRERLGLEIENFSS